MNKQQLSNALHVGGTLENALTGNYTLSASSVVQEALKLTQKHFWRFLPATLLLAGANVAIFFIALSIMLDSPAVLFDALLGKQPMTEDLLASGRIAIFATTVLSAPLYAGASLMGLSHAIGFRTKPRHIIKGMAYALAVTMAMCFISALQSVGNQIIPLLGIFLGIAFSMTILLICEKRLRPLTAMIVSFRAITKKLIPLTLVYIVIAVLFVFSYATGGIALLFALPFMFNVKGVLYREMFGVGIEVTVSQEGDDDSSSGDGNKEVFNA
ncbi:hypothetical protein A1OO_08050 [Enterovibrio norvegicus FF-33]|uniref:Proline and glycine rich transmembrane protein gene in bax n=1 Tax=Enterovibrio norvegicus FF-454 TaxID=1185651 RepID=A0A1E5C9M2_9GAMM|nr:hypothetical protein [Enterovibrio norvegicus]OEE62166.1 hypothetical protein A1OK_01275 [Enterovibrio norvegicus FF-454]OEE65752.1 hypothetical protein A1OO_08050 [Enterovibrio norvegicus FF-33]OEE82242.1 hypothetical protein A1OQ_04165 [Enterovibrio norvegicus FF-162]